MRTQATLPARFYSDQTIFEAERRQIWSATWLLVAHQSQVKEIGDYVALTIAGYPIIVVKSDAGIRAFHNVCRHRAGPLTDDGHGRCESMLVCRYHGWRYAFDGRLASARDFGPAEDFDVRDYSLVNVRCETWRGFIFVNVASDVKPLRNFVDSLQANAAHLPLETFSFSKATSHELECNWKTYVENYLEGYHIPSVHPFLNRAIDATRYEVVVSPPAVFHSAPQRDGSPVAGLWAWLWPCLGINIYTEGVMVERVWPLSPTRCRLDYMYLSMGGADVSKGFMEASEITTREDKTICEAVQRNLQAGIYETGRLSPKHESGVAWFQGEVDRRLKSSLDFTR